VHYGHLLLADTCREACHLREVWFVPAALSPHKAAARPAPAADRIAMLELAIAGNESFRVSRLETDRGGVSYTVETLEVIAQQQPRAELFFLMGADSLLDFPKWREPRRICQLALPVVVRRHGSPDPAWQQFEGFVDRDRLLEVKSLEVEMPRLEFSSSEMRRRIASGKSIRYWTPRAVQAYIESHNLYR
jgi:nicotinate-nucleotide adenylyltransferase